MDHAGKIKVAIVEKLSHGGSTIRSTNCSLLAQEGGQCSTCSKFRQILNGMLRQYRIQANTAAEHSPTNPSSKVNFRYLNTPQKIKRFRRVREELKHTQSQVQYLHDKLEKVVEEKGVHVDLGLHQDQVNIMEEQNSQIAENYEPGSFLRTFWEQQKKANSIKSTCAMRWHPLMVRWCLYLRHLSSSSYEMLRDSGILKLPSQRTLRDYTYYTKTKAGFADDVDEQLMSIGKVKTCPEREKYVCILMDEMHIKSDLVYDKHSGSLIGFVNIGEINSHLHSFEQMLQEEGTEPILADHMLVLMVRGLFGDVQFPYAQFPCTDLSGEQIYSIFWKAVGRLERCGFKVMALVCDGLSANRRFFKLHTLAAGNSSFVYKVTNPYSDDGRQMYFISDPPHLIKTVRNAWSSKARYLWCRGKDIKWEHLVALYEHNRSESGLVLVPKLKYEHIYLNNFSKMRVDLAAQVLSNSVATALKLFGREDMQETAIMADLFNKFFDCFNVACFTTGRSQKNPYKNPYRKTSDFRLKWLKNDFLGYLKQWEESVKARSGEFKPAQRKLMMLSEETLTGIRITVHSFVELVEFLLTIPGVTAFLSNKLCQDPLEKFFGQQRQRGRVHENPNMIDFLKSTQALRIVNGVCRHVKGNCRGSTSMPVKTLTEMSEPLPKRKKKTENK